MKQYKSLIGLKITDIRRPKGNSASGIIVFDNGTTLYYNPYSLQDLLKQQKQTNGEKEMTLFDYLRTFGIKDWIVDKRKTTGYRTKCFTFSADSKWLNSIAEKLNAIKCKDCSIAAIVESKETIERYRPSRRVPGKGLVYGLHFKARKMTKYRLIIRTSITPSEIIIS